MDTLTYSYEEAYNASLIYFNNDDLAAKVFIDKYALRDIDGNLLEKTPEDMHWRLAKEFARIEAKKFKHPLSAEEIFNLFDRFKYIVPQGSPMYGIGNNYQIVSLSNCYLLNSPEDAYNSILDTDKQLVNISKRRGGCGIDLSKLRPKGWITKNSSRTSTGIITWMERYSNSIREVGQSGRRGALMLTLSVHHPDIEDFISIKNDETKVTGANISVRLTQEFIDAVNNHEDYELRFPIDNPTFTKKISARQIWNKIIHSAWLRAEPGLLMWDNITKYSPCDAYSKYSSVGTNPCSELNLSELDSCRLLCINLFSYIDNPFTDKATFNSEKFFHHTKLAQRLMDDMVDLEIEKIDSILAKIDSDPESNEVKNHEKNMWLKIRDNCYNGRRTGTGITGLGDMIAALDIKYGSQESIKYVNEVMMIFKFGCYSSSIEMSKELGPFTEWDMSKESNHPFFLEFLSQEILLSNNKTISGKKIYKDMLQYGRRNVALTTIAPTGSVSIETQTTSGIEPLFMLEPYVRRKKINHDDRETKVDYVDNMGDKWQEFKVYHPKVKMWMDITGESDLAMSPWFGACANDIDWQNRVYLQECAQKHICHSISSTINLPSSVLESQVSDIYLTAFSGRCKGITVYRDGCRSGVLVAEKEANNTNQERPKLLNCDIHHISVQGTPYLVMVGLMNEQPYEVFACKNGILDTSIKKCQIEKMMRPKCYRAILDDDILLQPITIGATDQEEALTRMISLNLRYGNPINTIVDQLEKVHGDMTSFAKSIARALKKYIPDGTIIDNICEQCNQKTLIRQDGCSVCKNCGASKCS